MFTVDDGLLDEAGALLRTLTGLRFVVGSSGTGKTTICTALATARGVEVLYLDARIYGSWHARFDAARHPASRAWLDARDPLAWQLALGTADFRAFHEAATAEALDLLADELGAAVGDQAATVLLDGGFGSVAVLARAVPADRIACLSLPPELRGTVWTGSSDRRGFLEVVAGVSGVEDAVGRFLAMDAALSERMAEDAAATGIRLFERSPDEPVAVTASAVGQHLGLGPPS